MKGYYYQLNYLEHSVTVIFSDDPERKDFSVDQVIYGGRNVSRLINKEKVALGVLDSIEMKKLRT